MTRGFQAFILKVAPFFPLLVSALWLAGVASVWHSWLFCISPLQTFTTQNICPCQKCSSLNYWLFPQCFISWRGKSDAESAVTQHDWRYRCCSVPQLSVVCFTLLSVCCMYSHALCSDVNVCSCVCCVVMHVWDQKITCLTQHLGFEASCLNPFVPNELQEGAQPSAGRQMWVYLGRSKLLFCWVLLIFWLSIYELCNLNKSW